MIASIQGRAGGDAETPPIGVWTACSGAWNRLYRRQDNTSASVNSSPSASGRSA
jgi:hypothetical protein